MKFDFDEFTFQDEINFMNLNDQMDRQQRKVDASFGFNEDTIYQGIEKR